MSFRVEDLANAIRFLSIDAVEQAQSGHPGMPLGMATIATVLWKEFLKHNPKNPHWFNRDRFVLSNGHGSMLLYALLHLTGYPLSIADLKQFRQLHSKTPGHPECTHTPGVETTTGPLGQGLGNGVGMAIAEKHLAQAFNRPNLALIDHYTYVFAGDGCLMEGISHEACSLAGTLGLGKLIVFYDDNGISIDGQVSSWFTDDTALRFKAYHWQVIGPIDGHNATAITAAISTAKANLHQPTLIICKTVIGFGSPVAGSEKAHGAALGAEAVAAVRQYFHWHYAPFEIPDPLYAAWNHHEQGQVDENQWLECCHQYQRAHQRDYHEFLRRINGDLPDNWETASNEFIQQCRINNKDLPTRKSSQLCLDFYAKLLPEMLGGSADLSHSNNTYWAEAKPITAKDFSGNYLFYGVREFAMATLMNGLALHGGVIPYGGTFLVFSDYARNAIRLSAIMEKRVIYVFTHDSIGLGEDGPTHQPVEHAAMLRLTPLMQVWRPADLYETAIAWQQALQHHLGPTSLLLSRQNLPAISGQANPDEICRGAYILQEEANTPPELILIATGSEVHLALAAVEKIRESERERGKEKVNIRIVSMPCCERFLAQDRDYQEKVLPANIRKRIAIEAGASGYWYRFVGLEGKVIGLERFGVSAPGEQALNYLGFNLDNIVKAITELLNLA